MADQIQGILSLNDVQHQVALPLRKQLYTAPCRIADGTFSPVNSYRQQQSQRAVGQITLSRLGHV
ncbi:hypothetical protein NS383_16710 [Pseudomonas oryzihabitans]|nr:hypothetical protein NS383_16710 [Pseudomonas psychrotolerans]